MIRRQGVFEPIGMPRNGETRLEAYWRNCRRLARGAVGWRIVSRARNGLRSCRMSCQDDLWTRAAAALSLFKREGLPVEVLDELHWRIMPAIAPIQPLALDRGYLFWPARGYWRRPDGSHGGGGAGKLIEEMRRGSSSRGRP